MMKMPKKLMLALALSSALDATANPLINLDSRTAIEAGHAAIQDEAFIKAANIFEQALLASPNDPELHRHLGIGYYKSGRNEQAIERLNKALELSPADVESHYAMGVVQLARASELSALKVRGAIKSSIQHFETAIELDPSHAAARYYLIQILINAPRIAGGDKERARALNEALADISPLHYQVVNSTFAALEEKTDLAEELLLESHRAQPESTLVNFSLLSHYHAQGQYEKAIEFGNRFLRTPKQWDDNDLSSAHLLLAQCHQAAGNREQSLQHYALALTHSDNQKVIKQVQDAVKEIAGDV